MNEMMNNKGILNLGGRQKVTGSAVGGSVIYNIGRSSGQDTRAASESCGTRGIGVVTILTKEAKAVIEEFRLKKDEAKTREQRFYVGNVKVSGIAVGVVATQASGPGQRAAMTALGHLRRYYDPAVLVLVGIGGAIHHSITINDVVVATRVVYYDLRKIRLY